MAPSPRVIIDPPASGAWNMAVDEALLIDAAENGIATLRFYQWDAPTLSLGYFQKYDDRHRHTSSRDCACVRRQTGGGAILHDRELTYSVALPAGHPLARQTEILYSLVHDAFIRSLQLLLGDQLTGWVLKRRDQESRDAERQEPFLCFERRARGDVVLELEGHADELLASTPRHDRKILGSAQRRHRGAVLQHGSLLLNSSSAAPELPGLGDLFPLQLTPEEVSQAVMYQIAVVLRPSLLPTDIPSELQLKAGYLANTKYGTVTWTKRR